MLYLALFWKFKNTLRKEWFRYMFSKPIFITHIVNAINERIITAVAHGQPVAYEPDDVDVPVPGFATEG